MKLTVHMIAAKPTPSDPLAQRDVAVLLWEEDKEVIELGSQGSYAAADQAAMLAIGVAQRVFSLAAPTGSSFKDAVMRLLDAPPVPR